MVLSNEEIKRLREGFGVDISYSEVQRILPNLTSEQRTTVENIIIGKQRIFWNNPKTVKYYSELHPKAPFLGSHWEKFIETVNVQPNDLIVDLGCGSGTFIDQLLMKKIPFGKIIGIDYASRMLEVAKKKFSGNAKIAFIEQDFSDGLPFLATESVNKLVSNWGISYLSEEILREKIFFEICRVLKPKGTFILSGLIKGKPLPTLKRKLFALPVILFRWQWDIVKQGIHFEKDVRMLFPMHKSEELEEMIKNAGFEIKNKGFTIIGGSLMLEAVKV